MYSSSAGFIPSLVIAGIVLILSWWKLSHSGHYGESGRLGILHTIGVGAASFAVAFSVLNLALQPHAVSLKLVSQEVASGVLALRVISVTAAITFGRLMLAGMREEKFVIGTSSLSGDYSEDKKLLEVEKKRRANWPVEVIVTDATVLLLVLCLLWALQILGRHSLSIDLLNWSFAFSSDDLFMAASYRAERKVLPPRFDKTLIWIWRITTLALFCRVVFQQFAAWLASWLIVLIMFYAFWPWLHYLANNFVLWIFSIFAGLGKMFEGEGAEEVPAGELPGRRNQADSQSVNPTTAAPFRLYREVKQVLTNRPSSRELDADQKDAIPKDPPDVNQTQGGQ
jgi:hypothetical protein